MAVAAIVPFFIVNVPLLCPQRTTLPADGWYLVPEYTVKRLDFAEEYTRFSELV